MARCLAVSHMPHNFNDDPTIPPPGKRTGAGISSILPFLVKSLATKPQVPSHPDYESTVPQHPPAPPRKPDPGNPE